MKRFRYEDGPVDGIDAKILAVLSGNARITNAELARQVGLSGPSVAERIRRLEEAGVIGGYTIEINPEALGLPITAHIRVRPLPGELERVASILRGLPEIVECHRVTGDDCFIARACLRSVAHLEKVIDQIIPHATTNSAIIQSTAVKRRLPPIRAGEAV